MAKFLKSLFSSEKRCASQAQEVANENEFTPPLDSRRKLSISRSGRMKQNKKRGSIAHDFFGEDYHTPERKISKEYHVHGRAFSDAASSGLRYKSEQARTQTGASSPSAGELSANAEELGATTEELSARTEELSMSDQVSEDSLDLEREVEMAFKIIYNT